MYGKVFVSMFEGSLYGKFEATVVMMALITLADKAGIVDMTPQALTARTGFPFAIIIKGLQELQAPDKGSRTEGEDGRRIVLLDDRRDWGWRVVNYAKYAAIRSEHERREYHREYWQKRKTQQSQQSQQRSTESTYVDVDVDVDKDLSRFALFYLNYPKKKSRGTAELAWKKLKPDHILAAAIMAGLERAITSTQWTTDAGKYIPYPSSWLNARGWEDAHEEPRPLDNDIFRGALCDR